MSIIEGLVGDVEWDDDCVFVRHYDYEAWIKDGRGEILVPCTVMEVIVENGRT